MVSEFGLPSRCLREPDLKVPMDAVQRLLEASAERSHTEAFGLLMAEERRLSNLGPLAMLAREQPTLRLVVDALARYANRLNEALLFTIEELDDFVVLREELISGKKAGPVRQATELAIAIAFGTLQTLLGAGWKPKRVAFAHGPPASRIVHHRIFGRNVEFDREFNGIVWSAKDLNAPNANADPLMARYAQQLVDANYSAKSSDMTSQVRRVVAELLGSGQCTVDVAVQHLGMPRRTLHRCLSREGQTFSDIVDGVRRELAPRYMGNRRLSLTEVSSLLGFSTASAFSRWYRRQFDRTPTEGRAKISIANV
jgi:AraC-like DNA-binding protein